MALGFGCASQGKSARADGRLLLWKGSALRQQRFLCRVSMKALLCGFLETRTVSSSSRLLCGFATLREPIFRQTEHSVSRKAAKPQRIHKEERRAFLRLRGFARDRR